MSGPEQRSRREVLRFGGRGIALGAVLASCGSGGPEPALPPDAVEGATEEPGDDRSDVSLLNTVLSLEVLIAETYQVAVDAAFVVSREAVEALTLFRQHHAEHRDAIIGAVEAAEAEPFTTPNPVVKVALVQPAVAELRSERDFLRLAHDLESAAAQLAVHATTDLDSPDGRRLVMAIGGSASRRATVLDLLGELGNERLALYPTGNPLPSDAVVPD